MTNCQRSLARKVDTTPAHTLYILVYKLYTQKSVISDKLDYGKDDTLMIEVKDKKQTCTKV